MPAEGRLFGVPHTSVGRLGATRLYEALVPRYVRGWPLVKRLQAIFLPLLPYNFVYDKDYFLRHVDPPASRAAPVIADSILGEFKPKHVADVGCGTGALLSVLKAKGCSVCGLEYADAAITICRGRGLNVKKFDIERDASSEPSAFDVAVSMEVAEHLPERVADRYVALLAGLSNVVVFTAAHPGQGGRDHVNEQPAAYWIEKFRHQGLSLDQTITERWRTTWVASGLVPNWYTDNLMVFRRS